LIAKLVILTKGQGAPRQLKECTMTLSKILATSVVVGLMGSAAFANDINFSQTGGSVGAVTFTQTGTANMISSDGLSKAAAATVTGGLATLKLEQIGSTNKSSFNITPGLDSGNAGVKVLGNVAMLLDGSTNTSEMTVNQVSTGTLDFSFGVQGSSNVINANITAENSVIDIESRGDTFDYDIDQTSIASAAVNSITANFVQSGTGATNVVLAQSGADNTITMGAPSAYGVFTGTGGMTLNGAATVGITQTSASASYTATQSVAPGGTVTIAQN
jgi:hypothetical protein